MPNGTVAYYFVDDAHNFHIVRFTIKTALGWSHFQIYVGVVICKTSHGPKTLLLPKISRFQTKKGHPNWDALLC